MTTNAELANQLFGLNKKQFENLLNEFCRTEKGRIKKSGKQSFVNNEQKLLIALMLKKGFPKVHIAKIVGTKYKDVCNWAPKVEASLDNINKPTIKSNETMSDIVQRFIKENETESIKISEEDKNRINIKVNINREKPKEEIKKMGSKVRKEMEGKQAMDMRACSVTLPIEAKEKLLSIIDKRNENILIYRYTMSSLLREIIMEWLTNPNNKE